MNSLPKLRKPVKWLYFAVPLDLMGTAVYRGALAVARVQFPKAQFFEPARKHWTDSQWFDEWPQLLPFIQTLTVIPRDDDSVGRGCWMEIESVLAHGVPTFVYSHARRLFIPLCSIERETWGGSAHSFARVYGQGPNARNKYSPPSGPGWILSDDETTYWRVMAVPRIRSTRRQIERVAA